MALFVKSIRKISKRFEDIQKAAISAELPQPPSVIRQPPAGIAEATEDRSWKPVAEDLDEELAEAGDEEKRKLRERQREMIDTLDLSK